MRTNIDLVTKKYRKQILQFCYLMPTHPPCGKNIAYYLTLWEKECSSFLYCFVFVWLRIKMSFGSEIVCTFLIAGVWGKEEGRLRGRSTTKHPSQLKNCSCGSSECLQNFSDCHKEAHPQTQEMTALPRSHGASKILLCCWK